MLSRQPRRSRMIRHPCPASGPGKTPHFCDKHMNLKTSQRHICASTSLEFPLHILSLPAAGLSLGHFCSAGPQMGACWAARRCLGRFLLQLVPPAKSRLINFLGRWTMLEKSPVKGKRWKNHKMMEWFQLKRFYRAGTPYTRPGCSKRNPVARMVALDHPAKASLSNL